MLQELSRLFFPTGIENAAGRGLIKAYRLIKAYVAVSYTHLDVYKRQHRKQLIHFEKSEVMYG